MLNYLRLVRFPNLLMIAFTMYAMRWGLIYPILRTNALELQFAEIDFLLLVLSTVFITAAGYGINDYFDVRTDSLNRPDRVVVGKSIKRRVALALHWVLNTTAVLMGIYISVRVGYWQFAGLFVGTTGLLWYYSTTYKRQFLLGNLIVAMLTGMVPVLVLVFEVPSLNRFYADWLVAHHTNFYVVVRWVMAFAFFAFLTTLIREIIKDIEDFEGDYAFGRNTLPVVLGIGPTKAVVVALLLVSIGALGFVYVRYLQDRWSLIYLSLALVLPQLYLIWRTLAANKRSHYTHLSLVAKLLMLAGIGYLAVVNYNLAQL